MLKTQTFEAIQLRTSSEKDVLRRSSLKLCLVNNWLIVILADYSGTKLKDGPPAAGFGDNFLSPQESTTD